MVLLETNGLERNMAGGPLLMVFLSASLSVVLLVCSVETVRVRRHRSGCASV